MYNFLKKAFHLSSEKNEDVKIEDEYLKSVMFQAERNHASEKTLKTIRDVVSAIAKKDKKTLREICSASGIPEEAPLLRSIVWKINLKFLDLNVENWADIIAKKRSEYNNMKEAFIMKMEIDRKMNEDSSGNNTNNIIRKNGDSINETGEESKDSSSKSKSNSRNNLNCNNNSKSKLSSGNHNNKDNSEGLNCNSINNYNINNSKLGFADICKNLNEEENENKNSLDKNVNANGNASSNNFSAAFSRNPTFGQLTTSHTADASQKNLNQSKKGNPNNQNNNGISNENNPNDNNYCKGNLLENFIAKNQTDFSRNFLNLEFDERKLKKNKKNAVTNHNEIYKDFSRFEDNLLCNQVEIMKTYECERNRVSHTKSFLNNEPSAVNITFDNQANTDGRNFNNQNKPSIGVKRDKDFDFLKKLNEEKIGKTASNKNLGKVPLPNYKTNHINNININTNTNNEKEYLGRRLFGRDLINEANSSSNNKLAVNDFNVNSSSQTKQALTPQIKLNRNERDASNENKNRNKIDFNFSVIDFLNKNVPNNNNNSNNNKNNTAASNPMHKSNENPNFINNKDLNKFFSECDSKDKLNSLNFLKTNNSNNPVRSCNVNPSQNNFGSENANSNKMIEIKPINLNSDSNKGNSNYCLNNNNKTADNTSNKVKSKFTPTKHTHNDNKNSNNTDLRNSSEEKKESNNQQANLGKMPKGANDKSPADPLLESVRKNAKMANYEDKALIEEIYKDMKRTHTEFGFLLKPAKPKNEDLFSNFHLEKILTQKNKNAFGNSSTNIVEDGFQPETHLDVIARLLYIFAKLNKNIRYVQGMNELASLIYYVIMQEEDLEKISLSMPQPNKAEKERKKNNNNQNIENVQMQNNKVSYSGKRENGIANANRNKPKSPKDKEKFGVKSTNTEKANEKGQSLDASSSVNASTKLCDLARLEEAEEEKNFFDLNADRKVAEFRFDSPLKAKLHQQENLVNFLQKKNQQQNYLLGSDKKGDYDLTKHVENPTINEFNNLHYLESVNNHEELFGLSSNRLVRNVNQSNKINEPKKSNNKMIHGYNNNDAPLNVEANCHYGCKLNQNGFGFDKQDTNKDEKQTAFGYLDKLNYRNNLFLTPDVSKDRYISKLNPNQLKSNGPDKNGFVVDYNNDNKLNNLNSKLISVNAQSNYIHASTNMQQNTLSALTDRAGKNAFGPLNPKTHLHSNLKASKANSPETDFEADTFWCFCYLMDQLKYIYLRSEDHKERGVMRKLDNLKNLLKLADKNLFSHLENVSVDVSLFGFKWFVLLFSQNFCIKDALKIWDLLLFVEHPTDIFYKVYYFALAVFECKRSKIIGTDFPGVVLQLQNLNDISVDSLIAVYRKIMKDSGKKIKKALGY